MSGIIGIAVTLLTAAIFGRLLAWFAHKIWLTIFVDERETTQIGAGMMIVVLGIVRLLVGPPLAIMIVPLALFTLIYPWLWIADMRSRPIERWEWTLGSTFYFAITLLTLVAGGQLVWIGQ